MKSIKSLTFRALCFESLGARRRISFLCDGKGSSSGSDNHSRRHYYQSIMHYTKCNTKEQEPMNTLWFPVLSDRFPGSRGSISISSGSSPSSESRGSPGFLVLVAFVVLLKMNGYKPGNETLSTSAGRRPFFSPLPSLPVTQRGLIWVERNYFD